MVICTGKLEICCKKNNVSQRQVFAFALQAFTTRIQCFLLISLLNQREDSNEVRNQRRIKSNQLSIGDYIGNSRVNFLERSVCILYNLTLAFKEWRSWLIF